VTAPDFWTCFWTAFNNAVLALTLVAVAYYTAETVRLRSLAQESNRISYRPLLTFDASVPTFAVKNEGVGPAFNACLVFWNGQQLFIARPDKIPGVMPIGPGYYRFDQQLLEQVDSTEAKRRLPKFKNVIDRIVKSQQAIAAVTYADMWEARFCSMFFGDGGQFGKVFELIILP
jgi:hypothetical protein